MVTDFKTKILYKCLEIAPGEPGVDVEIFPASSETAVVEVIKYYIAEYFDIFREYMNAEGLEWGDIPEEDKHKYFRNKFVNYDEFIKTHALPLNFEYIDNEKPVYYYKDFLNRYFTFVLNINNANDFIYFKKTYTPDIQGYLKLLQNSQAEKLKSFFFRESRPLKIPVKERTMHTYITGGTGSGKSELIKLLIYQDTVDIEKGIRKNVILIDPHGDLAEAIFRLKLSKEIRNNIIYFDPFLDEEKKPCINPFELFGDDKSEKSVDFLSKELTETFQEIIENSNLSTQMQALLMPCLTTLLKKGHTDFSELQKFMNDQNNAELVELGKKLQNKNQRNFFLTGFYNSAYTATKTSLYTKLQSILNSSNFSDIATNKSTINLKKILNEDHGKIILFNLSKGRLGGDNTKLFGRLVLALIGSIAFNRANIPESERIPCYLYIDECQNFIGRTIFEGMTELRKYCFHFHLANQIVAQDMTAREKELVLSNTNIKLIGRNAVKSLKTLALETGGELEDLQNLKTGEFYLKIGQKPGFIVKVPKTLLNPLNYWPDNSPEMQHYKNLQLEKYYRKPQEVRPIYSNTGESRPQPAVSDERPTQSKAKQKFEEKTAGVENLKPMFDDDF